MSKQKTRGALPALRFPEFCGMDEWAATTIGHIGNFSYGKSAPKWSLTESAGTPCVRYGELYTRFGAIIEKTHSKTNIDPKNLRFSKGGEILVPRVGEKPEDFGRCCSYLPIENVAIGEMISIFRTPQNPIFYTYYFRNLYKQFAKVVEGQNVKNLYYSELQPIEIFRPSLPEQKKIADCLTSADELILAHSEKLNTLKAHKKGLMQQLFPAMGEILPRLRFQEFEAAEKWSNHEIGDFKPFVTSGSRGWAAFYSVQGSLFVRITNLSRESVHLDLTDKKFVKLPPGSSEGKRTQLKENDLLISITADIGMIGFIDETIPAPAFINQHIALVRFTSTKVHSKFMAYFLASEQSQSHFRATTDVGAKAGMSLSAIQKIKIMCPSFAEQKKIADCLTSVDDLIVAQTQKVAALTSHKQGLMQQLFPAVAEVHV